MSQPMPPPPITTLFYTLKEASEILNLSPATIQRLIKRGLLKKSTHSRHIRISKTSIATFVNS
jgi:excisionase family DNA binding protein